ncbi:MAG TPA: hypothetical protein VFC19_01245 [Candidatus Limnocylindrales bacterium]|nr:hypothetical protein [Candidatus Limnocylindrales bacterium]
MPGLLVAGAVIGTTALFTNAGAAPPQEQLRPADLAADLDATRQARDEAQLSRSLERSQGSSSSTAAPAAVPSPTPTPTATPAPPAKPVPVAGLVQLQMNNAATIVKVGQNLGLPRRAIIIGMATAMQESNLYNLASTAIPESYDYPNEGSGSDYDSVGIFQQRPSAGWGTVANLMKPAYQAEKFFTKLMTINWQNMSLTAAAQAVQVSAFPDAYTKHESRATTIVDALLS